MEEGWKVIENILIRMPKELDYFLAASAVVQDFWVQMFGQLRQGVRRDYFQMTIELGEESQFFLTPLFPKMQVILRDEERLTRGQWDCVIDMRNIEETLDLARANRRHLTDAWGIQFGSSPQRQPELGGLSKRANVGGVDVLIDEKVPDALKIQEYFGLNYPEVVTDVCKIDGNRVSLTFTGLSRTRVYVGYRSGASALGSTMGKAVVECYPDDLPLWFLSKEGGKKYRAIYGETFPVEIVWNVVEEMWLELNGMQDRNYDLTPQMEMTLNA